MRYFPVAALLMLFQVTHIAPAQQTADVRLELVIPGEHPGEDTPAAAWLKPIHGTPELPFPPRRSYTLMQKNRTFVPHLLVIPVGSTVNFPNADPFFHNVFSLFDGKRFDLGLYEAGSEKQVQFSREGVSYIFCNIHPEMSAVVVALSTPLYAIADQSETAVIHSVPNGDYQLSIWVEGVPQAVLNTLSRPVHVAGSNIDLGHIRVPLTPARTHTNKFGEAYDTHPKQPY
jgi:hypothetical protein